MGKRKSSIRTYRDAQGRMKWGFSNAYEGNIYGIEGRTVIHEKFKDPFKKEAPYGLSTSKGYYNFVSTAERNEFIKEIKKANSLLKKR